MQSYYIRTNVTLLHFALHQIDDSACLYALHVNRIPYKQCIFLWNWLATIQSQDTPDNIARPRWLIPRII